MKFGELLKQKRQAAGLSRRALSEASGVTFATIHGYEDGRRTPSFANVVKLAASLGLTCQDFASCEDVTNDTPTGDGEAAEPNPAARPMGKLK